MSTDWSGVCFTNRCCWFATRVRCHQHAISNIIMSQLVTLQLSQKCTFPWKVNRKMETGVTGGTYFNFNIYTSKLHILESYLFLMTHLRPLRFIAISNESSRFTGWSQRIPGAMIPICRFVNNLTVNLLWTLNTSTFNTHVLRVLMKVFSVWCHIFIRMRLPTPDVNCSMMNFMFHKCRGEY